MSFCYPEKNCKVKLLYIPYVSEKNFRYLIFYNFKTPEPIFVIFGWQYPDNPGSLKRDQEVRCEIINVLRSQDYQDIASQKLRILVQVF